MSDKDGLKASKVEEEKKKREKKRMYKEKKIPRILHGPINIFPHQ